MFRYLILSSCCYNTKKTLIYQEVLINKDQASLGIKSWVDIAIAHLFIYPTKNSLNSISIRYLLLGLERDDPIKTHTTLHYTTHNLGPVVGRYTWLANEVLKSILYRYKKWVF